MPGPATTQVAFNLRPNTTASTPAPSSTRHRPNPLLVVGIVAGVVLGASFAIGYFVIGPAKAAVVAVYSSHQPSTSQTIIVGPIKTSKPGTSAQSASSNGKPAAAPKTEISPAPTPADIRSTPAPAASKTLQIQPEQRKRDHTYFILTSYPPTSAQRLVAFWKASGLDAAIVSDDNTGLVQVVDLKGFTSDQIGSAAFAKHEARLRDLGRKWKSQEKGPDSLEHKNAAKFTVNVAAPKPAARLKKD